MVVFSMKDGRNAACSVDGATFLGRSASAKSSLYFLSIQEIKLCSFIVHLHLNQSSLFFLLPYPKQPAYVPIVTLWDGSSQTPLQRCHSHRREPQNPPHSLQCSGRFPQILHQLSCSEQTDASSPHYGQSRW